MHTPQEIARHLRAFYQGPNSAGVNLREALQGCTWQEATTQVGDCNTILALTFHLHYYPREVLKVLRGGPLEARDKYSYDHPPIASAQEWEALLKEVFATAEAMAQAIEQLPPEKLGEIFVKEAYGNFYQNLHGIIEHAYYHLGQIVLLRKSIAAAEVK